VRGAKDERFALHDQWRRLIAPTCVPIPIIVSMQKSPSSTQCGNQPGRQFAAKRSGQSGFTLIEMMIAVAIASLLIAIAFPSFMDAIRKSRRSEAFATINAVQQAQERWRSNHSTFAAALSDLGISATTSNGYYTMSIDDTDGGTSFASSYSVTATGVDGKSQASDSDCTRLRSRVQGGNILLGSATAGGAFSEVAGNRCWSR
jgi:type IV pilus assembly protein PilE